MRQATISLVSLRSSLVNLPWSVVGRLVEDGRPPQTVVVSIQWTGKNGKTRKLYAGWSGDPSDGKDSGSATLPILELDRGFAPHDLVEARRCSFEVLRWSSIPLAGRVDVEPVSVDDWEVIEAHPAYVEENLLAQVRVAAKDMVFAVWVLGRTRVRLRVVETGNEGVVKFGNDTEIVISPKTRAASAASGGATERKEGGSTAVKAKKATISTTSHICRVCRAYQAQAHDGSAPVDSTTFSILKSALSTFPRVQIRPLEVFESGRGRLDVVLTLDSQLDEQTLVLDSRQSELLGVAQGGLVRFGESDRRAQRGDQGNQVDQNDPTSDTPSPLAALPVASPSLFLAGNHKITQELEKKVQSLLGTLDSTPVQTVLLTGGAGSGKTTLLSNLLQSDSNSRLRPRPWTTMINCAKIADDRLSTLKEGMSTWFDQGYAHSPSLLLLDDLDRLLPAEMEHVDSLRSRQLAELLLFFASRPGSEDRKMVIVASAKDSQSTHHILAQSHFITETVAIRPPDKTERSEILQHSLTKRIGEDVSLDFARIALETEGFLANDLNVLVERAILENLVRGGGQAECPVSEQDFTQAQKGFVPLSLREVTLEKSSTEWSDIGGLEETRRILRETLEWPTKYAAIFKNCPLRLRSGLLLYGYPGCGKTLLASAIAKECGLNFISVKGPELLNKYIGASEKSVRDLFERASSAKPCVLFFDEFDSIAPKRGHDSTGVTDRVVNQMLTLMDGAEGLDGVYVLAATSRPDLIDPALLRPGRLDKSLLCDMPDSEERAKILKALTSHGKLTVASDVNLDRISKQCVDFTGADLQALLYNAHLAAVHERLTEEEGRKRTETEWDVDADEGIDVFTFSLDQDEGQSTEASKSALIQRLQSVKITEDRPKEEKMHKEVIIKERHLESALAQSKASLPKTERMRLQRIYDSFVSGRSGKLPSGEASDEIGGRSSLM